jgi:hypothetical protein
MEGSAARQLEWWSALRVLHRACSGVLEELAAAILICSGGCWSDVVEDNMSVM